MTLKVVRPQSTLPDILGPRSKEVIVQIFTKKNSGFFQLFYKPLKLQHFLCYKKVDILSKMSYISIIVRNKHLGE